MSIEISEEELRRRLESPNNFLNRLKPNSEGLSFNNSSKDSESSLDNSSKSIEPPSQVSSSSTQNNSPSSNSTQPESTQPEPPKPKLPEPYIPPKPKQRIISSFNFDSGMRGKKVTDHSEETKLICAALAHVATPKIASEVTGVSLSTTYQYMRGEKQVGEDSKRTPDEALKDRLQALFPAIQDSAVEKFKIAAGFLTQDTMGAIPKRMQAITASQIMQNMSKILGITMPREKVEINNNLNAAKVVVMTSEQKNESDYEIVEAEVKRIG